MLYDFNLIFNLQFNFIYFFCTAHIHSYLHCQNKQTKKTYENVLISYEINKINYG